MDDVDAVQAQLARNMLDSGDWVTARLDGVPYLEKSPLPYWMMAVSYMIFGVHDWAARLPQAIAAILLCWLTARFGQWAFGRLAGMYAGLCLATSIGLFLFTRVLIPDDELTLAITAGLFSLVRLLDEDERHPRAWVMLLWASLAIGMLLKGLIAVVIPVGAGVTYLLFTRQLFLRRTWNRLCLVSGMLLLLAIAAPWYVLATLRNPPYLDFTMHSEAGSYHGFFWFYFINEHLLRFLNLRYPRDYNTVPRLAFWLFHLLWLFPWSVYLPATFGLSYRTGDRAARARLLALCWAGFVLLFFSFSTTQEYYSMPCYPALALLLGSTLTSGSPALRWGTRLAGSIAALGCVIIVAILWLVRGVPAPGDIAQALRISTDIYADYTLSLGHLGDLTLRSFAYLRLPLVVAAIALFIGAFGAWRFRGYKALLSMALMMALFFHAARLALITFEPYMGSRILAEALVAAPPGQLIIDDPYYPFSSLFFYANRNALLLNGRVNNLEYGSYAPGAPNVFINDADLVRLWPTATRHYLLAEQPTVPRLEKLVGKPALHLVRESGGKFLFANSEKTP
jgi:hypothetical protein